MHRVFDAPLFEARYNVAPTQSVPIVRAKDSTREMVLVRWGLIPSWAKDANIGYRLINATADTVATKPSFRSAFKKRRCLIPADGFYERQKLKDGGKQPYLVRLNGEEGFAFAGLWETWTNPEKGEEVESCTILTTAANEPMKPIHDRLPVILPEEAYTTWLDKPDAGLLQPFPAEKMEAAPVSTYVNNPRNQGPKCIDPVSG
jgi:putative SOS response-associated peptidase YedK